MDIPPGVLIHGNSFTVVDLLLVLPDSLQSSEVECRSGRERQVKEA